MKPLLTAPVFAIRTLAITLCVTFAIALGVAKQAQASQSNVRGDTCSLLTTLLKDGAEPALAKLQDMFSHDPDTARRVVNALASMKDMKFLRGNAYIVADFGGLAEQHFLVLSTDPFGTLYFRLRYELQSDQLVLENIAFNTDYNKMFEDGPFAQAPEPIACG